MANRYYTLLIVPEKTSQVRKIVIPSWLAKTVAASLALTVLIGMVMVLDYWFVMSEISENKQLKLENRRLKQQVQVFKNKMTTIENTMDRIKTFTTRLKVITNIEDQSNLLQSLNRPIPEAESNIGTPPTPSPALTTEEVAHQSDLPPDPLHNALTPSEETLLRKDQEQLDEKFSSLNSDSLYIEQMLQDEYELLADQKSFLAALPTRKPVVGYFTNGFGIRRSPFGGRVKMHEGLDIANHPGTPIRAPADGVVTFAATKPGYGQTLVIDHGYGLETWYGHTRKILVSRGQKIQRGDTVAQLGTSGRSTGPHLHYEVRVHGTPVDPLSYILEN